MDSLPPEIILIFAKVISKTTEQSTGRHGNQSRRTLKALRLGSNIKIANIVAPALFKEIPLWLGKTSIQKLTKVAENHTVSVLYPRIAHGRLNS